MSIDSSGTRADDCSQTNPDETGSALGDGKTSRAVTAGREFLARLEAAYGEDAVPHLLEYAAYRLNQIATPEEAGSTIEALRVAIQGKTAEQIQQDQDLLGRLGELLLGSNVNTLIIGDGNVIGDNSTAVVIKLPVELLDRLEAGCGDEAVVYLQRLVRILSSRPEVPESIRQDGATLVEDLAGKTPSEVRKDKALLERLAKFLLVFVSAIADIYALVQLWLDLRKWIAARSIPAAEIATGALRPGAESARPSPPASESRPKLRMPDEWEAQFDPRRKYPLWEPNLVLIPNGEFLMGSDPRTDRDADDDEKPQHRIYLSDYYIGKTPVTNAQYLAFVYASKREPPSHWRDGDPPGEILYHPVTSVSWYDAVAYCQWLAQITGKPYRLPTEAEWEKAARGRDGWIFPWDNRWRSGCANTSEASIGGTTRVGRYSPRGDSPYGCTDMAGNVWEWTSSLWGIDGQKPDYRYPYRSDDGRENHRAGDNVRRVLRGGAFYIGRGFARCAFRGGSYPYRRCGNVGFRVVVSPSAAKRPSSAL